MPQGNSPLYTVGYLKQASSKAYLQTVYGGYGGREGGKLLMSQLKGISLARKTYSEMFLGSGPNLWINSALCVSCLSYK